MLRPSGELSQRTCERLDRAVAMGACETWIDRAELGLSEPSLLGRWLCALEVPGAWIAATGSSGPDPDQSVESAALRALERFGELADGPRRMSDRPRTPPHNVSATRIPVAQLDPALDLGGDARAERAGDNGNGAFGPMRAHPHKSRVEAESAHITARGVESPSAPIEGMRRHVRRLAEIGHEGVEAMDRPSA